MALFKRTPTPTEECPEFDHYVDNLVSESDTDITRDIESHFSPAAPRYGISDAVDLMRKLPTDNSDVVIKVVRETLQSAHIDINSIISDADVSLSETEQRLADLASEIENLKSQVHEKQEAVGVAKKEIAETELVKELLVKSQDTKFQELKSPIATTKPDSTAENLATSKNKLQPATLTPATNTAPSTPSMDSASIGNNHATTRNYNTQIRQS